MWAVSSGYCEHCDERWSDSATYCWICDRPGTVVVYRLTASITAGPMPEPVIFTTDLACQSRMLP